MRLDSQKNKKIGIFGLGKTGISCFNALKETADKILCYDENNKQGIDITPLAEWHDLDHIIVSPGVSLHYPKKHKIVTLAEELNIPLFSDIDLLSMELPNSFYIGITGTKGKSTTAALLHHILQDAKKDFLLGGNIGIPCLDLKKASGYILELSSFQLELVSKLPLSIAIILNIMPDHLDRYSSFEDYKNTKYKILELVKKNSTLILNIDDPELYSLYQKLKNNNRYKIIPISIKKNYINNSDNTGQSTENINIVAAKTAASILGINIKNINSSTESFNPLPHRMQYIGRYKNIHFYNDSKATTPCSVEYGLSKLKNIYWIAGGILKIRDIGKTNSYISNINKAYFFGSDKNLMKKKFCNQVPVILQENLEKAFEHAFQDALLYSLECNIVLSPMCSSFDQFNNAEERGLTYIKYYKELLNK